MNYCRLRLFRSECLVIVLALLMQECCYADRAALRAARQQLAAAGVTRFGLTESSNGLFNLSLNKSKIPDSEVFAGLPLRSLFAWDSELDLDCLRGMPLKSLELIECGIQDLTPVASLPLTRFKLSSQDVSPTLTPLADTPLEYLVLHDVPVTDISALRRLKLERCGLSGTKVKDLSPLTGMPLISLDIDSTPVSDLRPLKGLPLLSLVLQRSSVVDLSPLEKSSIRHLALAVTRVADLGPLAQCPLVVLDVSRTAVSNLAPIATCPLRWLDISHTAVSDLAPIADLKLKQLKIAHTGITNIAPLLRMPLETLEVSPGRLGKGIEALRKSRTLKSIGLYWNRQYSPDVFWRLYDERGLPPDTPRAGTASHRVP